MSKNNLRVDLPQGELKGTAVLRDKTGKIKGKLTLGGPVPTEATMASSPPEAAADAPIPELHLTSHLPETR